MKKQNTSYTFFPEELQLAEMRVATKRVLTKYGPSGIDISTSEFDGLVATPTLDSFAFEYARLLEDQRQDETPGEDQIVGTIVHVELEGGFYGIELPVSEGGEKFLPLNIQSELEGHEGKEIQVTQAYSKLDDDGMVGIFMWGTMIFVDTFVIVDGESTQGHQPRAESNIQPKHEFGSGFNLGGYIPSHRHKDWNDGVSEQGWEKHLKICHEETQRLIEEIYFVGDTAARDGKPPEYYEYKNFGARAQKKLDNLVYLTYSKHDEVEGYIFRNYIYIDPDPYSIRMDSPASHPENRYYHHSDTGKAFNVNRYIGREAWLEHMAKRSVALLREVQTKHNGIHPRLRARAVAMWHNEFIDTAEEWTDDYGNPLFGLDYDAVGTKKIWVPAWPIHVDPEHSAKPPVVAVAEEAVKREQKTLAQELDFLQTEFDSQYQGSPFRSGEGPIGDEYSKRYNLPLADTANKLLAGPGLQADLLSDYMHLAVSHYFGQTDTDSVEYANAHVQAMRVLRLVAFAFHPDNAGKDINFGAWELSANQINMLQGELAVGLVGPTGKMLFDEDGFPTADQDIIALYMAARDFETSAGTEDVVLTFGYKNPWQDEAQQWRAKWMGPAAPMRTMTLPAGHSSDEPSHAMYQTFDGGNTWHLMGVRGQIPCNRWMQNDGNYYFLRETDENLNHHHDGNSTTNGHPYYTWEAFQNVSLEQKQALTLPMSEAWRWMPPPEEVSPENWEQFGYKSVPLGGFTDEEFPGNLKTTEWFK